MKGPSLERTEEGVGRGRTGGGVEERTEQADDKGCTE
jgi:hypothetical protein